MANYQLSSETRIWIPNVINDEETGAIFYQIKVKVDHVEWDVLHRYSDFVTLHDKLVEEGIDRDLLPPKKLLGNKEPAFLMKRRKDLESYIQGIFHFLAVNLPTVLAEFLHFTRYDIHFILQNIAEQCYQREVDLSSISLDSPDGEDARTPSRSPDWSPLEMHSLCERLKHPAPPTDPQSKRSDFTNVADMCCRLATLDLTGNNDKVGSSNLELNQLTYDFLAFRCLRELVVENIIFDSHHVTSLGILRTTLEELRVRKCSIKQIADVLLCDIQHSQLDNELPVSHAWTKLLLLDLSENDISCVDRSIRLAARLETLLLDANCINSLDQLTGLPRLRRLHLASNKIKIDQDLHTMLGQVTHIDLSYNKISSLAPFKKLYCLQELKVCNNRVSELDEVFPICSLPCLESVDLANNKVQQQVDYRLKVFEAMQRRCREIKLDGELATQAELDKVSVLMALRVTREKKSPISLFGNLPNSESWKS